MTMRMFIILFIYLFSSSTSNGIEVQTKNILAERPTRGSQTTYVRPKK